MSDFEKYKPMSRLPSGIEWSGYAYHNRDDRDDHARLFHMGAIVKLAFETGWWRWKRYHLIVGMP